MGTEYTFNPALIGAAAERLRAGRLVAFPTETVYGLGADARNPAAVRAIYAAKGRPADHPVIVHLATSADPGAWTRDLPPLAVRLIERFWPGPLTLILPRAAGVADIVCGGQDSVGIRCPDHPVAQALLHAFGGLDSGLAAPSANRFGRISPTTAAHVRAEFPDPEVLILDGGPCRVGIESTIIDLSRWATQGPVLLRPGNISAEDLAAVLGDLPQAPDSAAPRVSGSLIAHYAPATPLQLASADVLARLDPDAQAVWTHSQPLAGKGWLRAPATADEYARALYASLRQLDESGYPLILIEIPPALPGWDAVHDRLRRAAAAHTA